MSLHNEPTRTWQCQKCGRTVERYRGMDDVQCECGAWYNSFGQRLRDDWQDNMSNWDENISDLDGFEESQLRKEYNTDTPENYEANQRYLQGEN